GMELAAAIGVAVLWRAPAFHVEGLMGVSATPEAAPDRLVTTMELHLPAVTWYTIQTGVFSTEGAARDKADDYTDRGAPGTVVSSSGKWRVFIAAYGREEDASAVRQRLGEMQRVETYLYAWECPEVHLRLTGPGAQLDTASAGMTLLQGAAEVMRDTAMLLDASQVTIQDALAELSELDGQLALWTRTARNAFGSQVPEMVKLMLTMAEHCSEKIAVLKGVEDPAALSSALKGCGMEQYDRMVSLRTSLLSQ
ncbi:MAG: SPOR domain-containing protein, partial [Clostridia bacterium]|nr:SPOR domain-containing protein [Clostridia bacterium]